MANSKEIFRLRSERLLDEALALAKSDYHHYPDDIWVKRAYGFVLYDLCKKSISENNNSEATGFIFQFDELRLPDDEETLHKIFNQLRQKVLAEYGSYERARQLYKAGDYLEAIKAFQSAEQVFESDTYFEEAYGWAIFKYLKQRNENIVILPEAIKLVRKYISLSNTTPSLLHSQLLRMVVKIAEENEMFPFLEVFNGWRQKGWFSPEDYHDHIFEDKKFSGLAEKTFMLLGQQLIAHSNDPLVPELLLVLEEGVGKFPQNIWLPYYKAKALIQSRQQEQALSYLTPVVKEKRNDYWSWALLGEALQQIDLNKAISCYCKALLCKADEKFLANVRADFGSLLRKANLLAEAKTEYTISINTRNELGYKIPSALNAVTDEPWFQNTVSLSSNRNFYLKNIPLAESILFDDIPWTEANVGETFERPNEPGVLRAKIYFKSRKGLEQLQVKDKQFGISSRFSQGQPIKIKCGQEGDRWALYQLDQRPDGTHWDALPSKIAIVDHINSEKQLCHYIVDKSISGVIKGAACDDLQVGDFLNLRYRLRKKDDKQIFEVIDWQPTEQAPSLVVFQRKSGLFRLHDGGTFGFVEDVFVSPELIQKYDMQQLDGRNVEVGAIISYNDRKKVWAWRAIKLRIPDSGENA